MFIEVHLSRSCEWTILKRSRRVKCYFDLPPSVFCRKFSEKSLTQRGSNRPSAFSTTRDVFSIARPGRSPEWLHRPNLLTVDHIGFKEIKRLNNLSGLNPVCLNAGMMKPRRGSPRSGHKETGGGHPVLTRDFLAPGEKLW